MPDIDVSKNKKNARLGRGLGSLLGPQSYNEQPSANEQSYAAKPEPVPTADNVAPQQSPGPTPQAAAATSQNPALAAPPEARPEAKEENRIWIVAMDKVKPNKEQPRKEFSPEDLRDLSASIKSKGIIQPITVRRGLDGEFEIVAGERRWRAAQLAGLHEVPVIIRKLDKQSSLEIALIENIQRQNLNAIEEAEAYQHLLSKYHLTQQQIAERVGKERATVANSLRLLGLDPEVRDQLKTGALSAGHAKVILGLADHEAQRKLAKKIVNLRLSVRAAEKLVAQEKQAAGRESDENSLQNLTEKLADGTALELQKIMGRKVGIDYKNGKGKILINFYSDDELTEIVQKIKDTWKTT